MNLFKDPFGILLIPVAIIIGVLSLFPFHWILYFTLVKGQVISGVDISGIERMFTPFVFTFSYVLTGFKIPKTYKFQNAGMLFIIYFLFWIGLIILGLFKDEIYSVPLGFSWVTFLGLIGGILALIVSYKLDGGASFKPAINDEDYRP